MLEKAQRQKDLPKTEMFRFMDKHYQNMKTDIGVDINYAEEQDDPMLDVVLKKLRPNSNAANFREFMVKQQNILRPTPQKFLSRRVNQDEERKSKKLIE